MNTESIQQPRTEAEPTSCFYNTWCLDTEDKRKLWARATRELFSYVHDLHLHENAKVLEVGSGTGFLRRNWPDKFKETWVSLDKENISLRQTKRVLLRDDYVSGSVYQIPFADDTFDVVCGLASYDELTFLEHALRESCRVLKKDGLFLHMLDTYPGDRSVTASNLFRQARGITKANVPQKESVTYTEEGKSRIENEESLIRVIEFFEKEMPLSVDDIYERRKAENFAETITTALMLYFDPTTVERGRISSIHIGKQTAEQRSINNHNFFVNNAGAYGSGIIPTNGYQMLKQLSPLLANGLNYFNPVSLEISSVNYVMAKK